MDNKNVIKINLSAIPAGKWIKAKRQIKMECKVILSKSLPSSKATKLFSESKPLKRKINFKQNDDGSTMPKVANHPLIKKEVIKSPSPLQFLGLRQRKRVVSKGPYVPPPNQNLENEDTLLASYPSMPPPLIPITFPSWLPSPSPQCDLPPSQTEMTSPSMDSDVRSHSDSSQIQLFSPINSFQTSAPNFDNLLIEFSLQNFETVTQLVFQYYSGDRECAVLRYLVNLMNTHPLYDCENKKNLSLADITIKIIDIAYKNSGPDTVGRWGLKPLLDLIYWVFWTLWKMYVGRKPGQIKPSSKDITSKLLRAMYRWKMSLDFQNYLKDGNEDPAFILFVAGCYLLCCDGSKAQIDDGGLEEMVHHFNTSISLLKDFHTAFSNAISQTEDILKRANEICKSQSIYKKKILKYIERQKMSGKIMSSPIKLSRYSDTQR